MIKLGFGLYMLLVDFIFHSDRVIIIDIDSLMASLTEHVQRTALFFAFNGLHLGQHSELVFPTPHATN